MRIRITSIDKRIILWTFSLDVFEENLGMDFLVSIFELKLVQ